MSRTSRWRPGSEPPAAEVEREERLLLAQEKDLERRYVEVRGTGLAREAKGGPVHACIQ